MGAGKVADVFDYADAPQHQGTQEAENTNRLDTIPVGKRGTDYGRKGRGNNGTDRQTERIERGV